MYSIDDLLKCIGVPCEVIGNKKLTFKGVEPIFEATDNSLSWIRAGNKNIHELVRLSKASYIICEEGYVPEEEVLEHKCIVKTSRPDIGFLRLVKNLYSRASGEVIIHPTAIIHPDAVLGKNVSIGPFSIIGNCTIGDNSIIESNVVIKDRVEMGANILISEFCNIGGQGFGHIFNEQNRYENMPHIGKVVIEDNVDIFPYCNIDRATLSETRIGSGTKIDHYCHISHNTTTGSNTMITAKVVMCGGSKVGNNVFIGVGSLIRDSVKVGDNTMIGIGSVVTKDVPNGETWVGAPAVPIEEHKALRAKMKNIIS
ncbi:MAG: DapH/DapD/GlmU-related protein [Flavipsychrobacter sp.]